MLVEGRGVDLQPVPARGVRDELARLPGAGRGQPRDQVGERVVRARPAGPARPAARPPRARRTGVPGSSWAARVAGLLAHAGDGDDPVADPLEGGTEDGPDPPGADHADVEPCGRSSAEVTSPNLSPGSCVSARAHGACSGTRPRTPTLAIGWAGDPRDVAGGVAGRPLRPRRLLPLGRGPGRALHAPRRTADRASVLAGALARLARENGLDPRRRRRRRAGRAPRHLYAAEPGSAAHRRRRGGPAAGPRRGRSTGWSPPAEPPCRDELRHLDQALVVAHEWLDVVPCPVAEVDDEASCARCWSTPPRARSPSATRSMAPELAWATAHWPTDDPRRSRRGRSPPRPGVGRPRGPGDARGGRGRGLRPPRR